MAEGARVAAVDLNFEDGTGADGALQRKLNVADTPAVTKVFDELVAELGGLDVLVNVAGIERGGPPTAFRTKTGMQSSRSTFAAPGMYDDYRQRLSAEELAEHDAVMAAQIPLGGKLGDPEKDLVPILVFLASDGSHFIAGQYFPIDGGWLHTR